MNEKNDRRSCIMMIASLLIVGSIGIFRRYIPISSAMLAFFRGLIGSASLLVFVLLRKKLSREKLSARQLLSMLLNGALLGINWIFLFEAFSYTTIAKATLAYYMEPTILLLLSPLLFKEKLTPRKLLCAAAALFGMVLVSGVIGSTETAPNDLRGILFGLGGACFYTSVVVLNKKIEGVDPYRKTIIQLFSAALVLLPYLLTRQEFASMTIDGRMLVLVLIVGVIHTGIVYALYFGSMGGLKAQTISALGYIDPVTAMLLSALVLHERLSLPGLIGALLIIGSAIVGEARPKQSQEPCL